MKKTGFVFLAAPLLALTPVRADDTPPVQLPGVIVYSPRVANQEPDTTFAMPVSALEFEPLVDLQARNQPEAQADVTLRGGIFDNTGFMLGATPLSNPQTGHYIAEIPVAPAMLGAPDILTGADNALLGFDANVGTVAYDWRRITTAGFASLGGGEDHTGRGEIYQGIAGQTVSADADFAHSRSDGTIPYGDSDFTRGNARVQLHDGSAQTDIFAGYQRKYFGWPDLYTPFGVDETENLQTTLFGLNHRVELGGGDYVQAGAYYLRNKDDYEFDRFIPGLYNPYQTTGRAWTVALDGRSAAGPVTLVYAATLVRDEIESTSLAFGPFDSRTMWKLSLAPEKTFALDPEHTLTVRAGATCDDSNRNGSAVSPVAELDLDNRAPGALAQRIYVSFATTSQLPDYTALDSSPSGGLFLGNPNLGRETSRNLELGARSTLAGWQLQAAVFARRDTNLVDWTYSFSSTAARTANPVDIDTAGFEFVARRSWHAFDLVLGGTVLTKDANYEGAPVDASFYALNYARERLTAAVTARLGGGFELRMDNVARIQEPNALRTAGGDDAVISDLSLAWRTPSVRGLELSAEVSNLWNSAFQQVPGVPAAGRLVTAGVRYAW